MPIFDALRLETQTTQTFFEWWYSLGGGASGIYSINGTGYNTPAPVGAPYIGNEELLKQFFISTIPTDQYYIVEEDNGKEYLLIPSQYVFTLTYQLGTNTLPTGWQFVGKRLFIDKNNFMLNLDLCSCEVGIGSLGLTSCIEEIGKPSRLGFMFKKAKDGTRNSIVAADLQTQAAIDLLLVNPDFSKRLYISPLLRSFASSKADSDYETFDDGTRQEIGEGIRTITGKFAEKGSTYGLSRLFGRYKCADLQVFIIHEDGKISGVQDFANGVLYGFDIDLFNYKFMEKTFSTNPSLEFTIDYARSVLDANFGYLDGSAFGSGSFAGLTSPIEVNFRVIAQTPTTITVEAATAFGGLTTENKYEGIAPTSLFLSSDGVTNLIISSNESPAGTYLITYSNEPVGTDLKLEVSVINGYVAIPLEFKQV